MTLRGSGTPGHGADPGPAPRTATGVVRAAVLRSHLPILGVPPGRNTPGGGGRRRAAQTRTPRAVRPWSLATAAEPARPHALGLTGQISQAAGLRRAAAPGSPGTGRATPTLTRRREKGRCAGTRPRLAIRRRSTRRASSPPGTSLVTAQPDGRQATREQAILLTMPDRRLPLPDRLPMLPDRGRQGPGCGRAPARAGGTRSQPRESCQVALHRRAITPARPMTGPTPAIRCWPSVIRPPT